MIRWAGRPRLSIRTRTPQEERATLACYDDDAGVTVSLDPNRHRRRETQDVLSRTTKLEEYDLPGGTLITLPLLQLHLPAYF